MASLVQATHRPALASHAGVFGDEAQSLALRHSTHAFTSGNTLRTFLRPVRHASRQSASLPVVQHEPFGPYVATIAPSPSGVVPPMHAMYASQIPREPDGVVPPSPFGELFEDAHAPDCSKLVSAELHASGASGRLPYVSSVARHCAAAGAASVSQHCASRAHGSVSVGEAAVDVLSSLQAAKRTPETKLRYRARRSDDMAGDTVSVERYARRKKSGYSVALALRRVRCANVRA